MFGRIGYFGLLQTSVFLSFSPFWCLKRLPSPLFPLFSPLRKIWAPFTGTLFLLFFSSSFFFWSEVSRETPLQFHPWFLFYPKFLISRAAALLGWTEKKKTIKSGFPQSPAFLPRSRLLNLCCPQQNSHVCEGVSSSHHMSEEVVMERFKTRQHFVEPLKFQ